MHHPIRISKHIQNEIWARNRKIRHLKQNKKRKNKLTDDEEQQKWSALKVIRSLFKIRMNALNRKKIVFYRFIHFCPLLISFQSVGFYNGANEPKCVVSKSFRSFTKRCVMCFLCYYYCDYYCSQFLSRTNLFCPGKTINRLTQYH